MTRTAPRFADFAFSDSSFSRRATAACTYRRRAGLGLGFALWLAAPSALAAPAIYGIAPERGPSTGGTAVTIQGAGFTPHTVVSFGGVTGIQVHIDSDSALRVSTPADANPQSAPHLVEVTVTNPDDQTRAVAQGFTYDNRAISTVNIDVGPSGRFQYGQPVRLRAYTFASIVSDIRPTGLVHIFDNTGSERIELAAIRSNFEMGAHNSYVWTGDVEIAPPTPGIHSIVATYDGDERTQPVTAGNTIEILKGETLTTLTSSADPALVGTDVTFTATVAANLLGGYGTPTGTVQFTEQHGGSSTTLGTVSLTKKGPGAQAVLKMGTLALGTGTITASYAGDDNFSPSSANPRSYSVANSVPTTVKVEALPNSSQFGAPSKFVVTVTSSGAPVTVGTVSLASEDAVFASPLPLDSSGHATFTTSSTSNEFARLASVGVHPVTASYVSPDGLTTTASVTRIVERSPTQTALKSTEHGYVGHMTLTLEADVSSIPVGASRGGAYGGIVSFWDGPVHLGDQLLGSPPLTIEKPSSGRHSFAAVYKGSGTFEGSQSDAIPFNAEVPPAQGAAPGGDSGGCAMSSSPVYYGFAPALGGVGIALLFARRRRR